MFNYSNLNDNEFESLCLDIMDKKLNTSLRKFAKGKDGGIDLIDDIQDKNIMVQVKHYAKTSFSGLLSSLKKEIDKVTKLNPKQYYICCSKELTPGNISDIYLLFKDYMSSDKNIISLNEIDNFLHDETNIDILRKHFKLWIESTNVLKSIYTQDVCIDGETLLYDINNEVKYFVKTSLYEQALNYLSNCRALLIIGDPGIGKTVLSKMILLYYISKGYKVRYTTDGTDLSSLKKALSQNPTDKEFILLDDCLGQAYFNMKETQGNQLTALIRYVNMHENKILVLNSRVTIYRDASAKSAELNKLFKGDECKIYTLNMSELNNLEKAKILYNHLYFNNVENTFFNSIRENRNYLKIINHPNYNPRIIEFISNPQNFSHIKPEDYYQYVMNNLNNPSHIWKNEYEERLKVEDRILLTTLYSITTNIAAVDFVKKCFNYRIKRIPGVDLSIDLFEKSIERLEQAFIKLIDYKGRKMLSVSNPSVNDFLDNYFKADSAVFENLINSCCSMLQYQRLLSKDAFDNKMYNFIVNKEILSLYFENDKIKQNVISYYTAYYKVLESDYEKYIHQYLLSINDISIYRNKSISKTQMIKLLTNKEVYNFYRLEQYFTNFSFLNSIFNSMDLREAIYVINYIDHLFEKNRESYIDFIKDIIEEKITDYATNIDASDYSFEIDIDSIIDECTHNTPDGEEIDEIEAAMRIEDEVTELAFDEINDFIRDIPKDIELSPNFLDSLYIDIDGCDYVINDYLQNEVHDNEDDWRSKQDDFYLNEEIDFIFK